MVKLEAIIDAMDLPEEWESFLDPETGEIVTVSEDERSLLDEEEEEAEVLEMPDWARESAQRIRKVLDSGRALALPDKFDIHEWELMRQFSASVEDPDASAELLEAIHGGGAFRLFRITTSRLGLRESWFEYRAEALRRIAREWLEDHGIAYVEESEGPGIGDAR